jgi:hypothetical protein
MVVYIQEQNFLKNNPAARKGRMQNRLKPLPVGHSFFDYVIEEGYYYVDKTLFIRDLLDKGAAVTLCTRPRRFGKTLNQTMLKCFFEDTRDVGGKDTAALFRGLKIAEAGERYMGHQGKYPVIFLSFREGKRGSFERTYTLLKGCITEEFCRHKYVRGSISDENSRELFDRLMSGSGSFDDYSMSLLFLCKCLEGYHGIKAVILIDEYDVPLENAWSRGFYDEMIDFIRPLLSNAFKDNMSLRFAVITGCLRVSKESIFTGLNNLEVISILSEHYDEYFGFTQGEVDAMLEYYGLAGKTQVVRDWYDGYLFGKTEVYNPWSTIGIVGDWVKNAEWFPVAYWSNTSGNDIVRKLVVSADSGAREELETLLAGGTISKAIHEDITYDEIYNRADNLWNFLFFTGYLKSVGKSVDGIERIVVELKIPNKELRLVFNDKIQEWFNDKIAEKDLSALFNAILGGNAETVQSELGELLLDTISFMDSAENFYHGFLAGILSRIDGHRAISNRESGKGRSDIALCAATRRGKAVIFELKVASEYSALPAACAEALRQIEERDYAAHWKREGYSDILKYGVAFYRKDCEVRVGGSKAK